MGFDGAIPFVGPTGIHTTAKAALFRVFKSVSAVIDPASFSCAEQFILDDLFLGRVEGIEPWDRGNWVKSMRKTRRRKILMRTLSRLEERGHYHKNLFRSKPFPKTEKQALFGVGITGPNVDSLRTIPRLIQAPHDETHLIAGPYLKPLTHAVKDVWNFENWIFYASVEPDKLNKWINMNASATSWWMGDYSAFDSTWVKQGWSMMRKFYSAKLKGIIPEFWDVLDAWERPHGVYRDRKRGWGFEYQSDECNASGRDDTALANAVLNGMVMALSLTAAYFSKSISQLTQWDIIRMKQLVRIAIVGDDSLVAASFDLSKYEEKIIQGIKSFGLVVKPCVAHSIDDITFLGMMPYETRGGYTWGPTIGRSLYKAYWQVEETNLPAWTKGVALQYTQFSNVPFLYDVACTVFNLLPRYTVQEVARDEDRPWTTPPGSLPKWDECTVNQLCRRYRDVGLTPQMIHADLAMLKRISRLPVVVRSQVFDCVVQVDEL